jgi:hypothetical protein
MTDKPAIRHWLATGADPVRPQPKADLLASMEKQLAEFMRSVAQDEEETSPPHLMSGHHACPCCSERGE